MEVPSTSMAMGASGLVAGPCTTEPSSILNLLPWQGQLIVPFETLLTMQPWWVHIAVKALNDPGCGWVTTTFLPRMIVPPPLGTAEVATRALTGGALVVAGAEVELLAAWLGHPASMGAQHVAPAP